MAMDSSGIWRRALRRRLLMEQGLANLDREAASHGVTTAWLAASWSWEGGPRGPAHTEALALALDSYRPRALTDLRLQIRAETAMVEVGRAAGRAD